MCNPEKKTGIPLLSPLHGPAWIEHRVGGLELNLGSHARRHAFFFCDFFLFRDRFVNGVEWKCVGCLCFRVGREVVDRHSDE